MVYFNQKTDCLQRMQLVLCEILCQMFKHVNNNTSEFFCGLKNHAVLELIKDRFYFVSSKNEKPKKVDGVHVFTVSDDEIDTLSISTIARVLKRINLVLSSPELTSKLLVCFAVGSENRRRNVSVCVGVFGIVYLGKDCADLGRMLKHHISMSVSDPLSAVHRALNRGFINFHDFNEDLYDGLGGVLLHWIVPRKILGFYGPLYSNDKNYAAPRQYLNYFRQESITTVVRVRHLKYEANPFVDAGLDHYDLNMMETVPSDRALECFLECCEADPESAVVVHCRELLGRVGCLAAAYLIKHHNIGADKAMAWIRICTPDCFFDSQKVWLKKKEKIIKEAGAVFRAQMTDRDCNSKVIGQAGICSYTTMARNKTPLSFC